MFVSKWKFQMKETNKKKPTSCRRTPHRSHPRHRTIGQQFQKWIQTRVTQPNTQQLWTSIGTVSLSQTEWNLSHKVQGELFRVCVMNLVPTGIIKVDDPVVSPNFSQSISRDLCRRKSGGPHFQKPSWILGFRAFPGFGTPIYFKFWIFPSGPMDVLKSFAFFPLFHILFFLPWHAAPPHVNGTVSALAWLAGGDGKKWRNSWSAGRCPRDGPIRRSC